MHIGETIRMHRRKRGLPTSVFCRLAGVGERTLRLLEQYGVLPKRIDVRERIAQALGLPYDQLWAEFSPRTETIYLHDDRKNRGGESDISMRGETRMTIGQKLKQYRKSQGLSIPAFARKAGVSDNTVVLIERYGILPKSVETRQRLADALGIGYDQLWNAEGGEE